MCEDAGRSRVPIIVAASTCTSHYVYAFGELDVDDAGVTELVVAAGLGELAEGGAAEVEVEGGDRVVVHVRDHHRLRPAGAGRVLAALDLPGHTQCHAMQ